MCFFNHLIFYAYILIAIPKKLLYDDLLCVDFWSPEKWNRYDMYSVHYNDVIYYGIWLILRKIVYVL